MLKNNYKHCLINDSFIVRPRTFGTALVVQDKRSHGQSVEQEQSVQEINYAQSLTNTHNPNPFHDFTAVVRPRSREVEALTVKTTSIHKLY